MEDLIISGAKVEKSESEGKESHSIPHNLHAMSIEKENSREDFQKYFLTQESFASLCEKGLHGELDNIKCRWTAWRAFLGAFQVGDEAKIREKVKNDRNNYQKDLDKFTNFRAKQKLDVEIDNPLSTSNKNPWNSFFEDNELKIEIRKDVERTYQDIDFFYTKKAQDMLTNILFVWSKQNPDLSYRQGMNELAGVFTYVCFTENFEAKNPENDLYDFLNDEKYAEADIYTVFCKVLALGQKEMFRSGSQVAEDPKKKKSAKVNYGESSRPNLPVVNRAVKVQEEYLPKLNNRLFTHLQKMGVEPQIYMIRWIRCMLSREYRVSQTLIIWDALFSFYFNTNPKPSSFEFLDYMCVAMLLYVAEQLIERDDGGMILGRLIKYPPVESVKNMIELAHNKVLGPLKSGKFKNEAPKPPKRVIVNEDESPIASPNLKNGYEEESTEQSEPKIILFNPKIPQPISKPKAANKEELFPSQTGPLDPLLGTPGRGSTSSGKNTSPGDAGSQFVIKKTINEPLQASSQARTNVGGIKPKSQNPFDKAAQIGGNAISSYHLKAMEKDTQQIKQNPLEKKDKKMATIQKIEEGNNKAIQTLKEVIELLKQENEKNASSALEEALNRLNETVEVIKENSSELQNIK